MNTVPTKTKLSIIKEKLDGNFLIKNFVSAGVLKILSIPLGLLISTIFARTLGPEGFGQYAFIMSLVALLSIPISGGLPQLITREITKFSLNENWKLYRGLLRSSYYWVLFFSVLLVGIILFLDIVLNLFPQQTKWEHLSIAAFLLPIWGLCAIRAANLRGLGYVIIAQIPSLFIQPLAVLFFIGIYFYFDYINVATTLLVQIFSAIIVFIISTIILRSVKPDIINKFTVAYRKKEWIKSLTPFTLLALVTTLNTQIGIVLLGLLHTDESVGAMRVAERGSQFVMLSLGVVNTIISPSIVRAYYDKNKGQLQKLSFLSARLAFVAAVPVAIVLIVFGKNIIGILFGDDYSSISYIPLVIMSAGQLLNVFFGSVGQILSMSGFENDTLTGHISALIINVIVCSLLIPKYGVLGAAIGVSTGLLTWNVILYYCVVKRLSIRPGVI